jgi:photosystem II stability/assembly factor-like uncharacterized protein
MKYTLMKKYYLSLLILLLCIPFVTYAEIPWQRLDANLEKVRFFPKNGLVFCLGVNGCMLRSTDNGATWKQPFTTTFSRLRALDFANAAVGIAVGDSGVLIRTIDGGKKWYSVPSPTTTVLFSVQFANNTEGFAVGKNGTILKTLDGGQSWKLIPFPYSFSINTISMDSPQNGFIAGDSSRVLRTTDGGIHWQAQLIDNLPIGNTSFQDAIRSNGTLYLFGGNLTIQKTVMVTTNDGINFTLFKIPYVNDIAIVKDTIYTIDTPAGISKANITTLQFTPISMVDTAYSVSINAARKHSLCFVNDTTALAVGERKFIYRTINRTDTWNLLSYIYIGNEMYKSIKFLNDTIGYLCGALRHIFHTTDGGATWLPEQATSTPLYNVYDIAFSSPTHGIAVAESGENTILNTTDGGVTYTPNSKENSGFIMVGEYPKIRLWGDSLALIAGGNLLTITTNRGKTWSFRFFNKSIIDCRIIDSITFLLSGTTMIMTHDKGVIWDSTFFPFSDKFSKPSGCWAIDSKNLIVVGSSQNDTKRARIFRSSDGGKTWEIVDSSDIYTLTSVGFSNSNIGYAISKRLLQTKDGGLLGRH